MRNYKPVWHQLQQLDISETARCPVVKRRLLDPESTVTRLYAEKCRLKPSKVPAESRIEFLSLAGCRASTSELVFQAINEWASHPTVTEINASGCNLTDAQREELVRKHPGVVFNLSKEFQESVRLEF